MNKIKYPHLPIAKTKLTLYTIILLYNSGHNILELHNILIQSHSPQVKQILTSSIVNLVYELPHELPNNLSLRILGN